MVHVVPPDKSQNTETISQGLVRYGDLRPCTNAFIDARTPGSASKENFTIIGPGVAESPDQYVHIDVPHGFNIGGARQPPRCTNSQHSHETAEVFVIHSGTWAFYLGSNCEDGEVVLNAGDTISIPVHVFRGFENVGDDVGFMFAVLGGDDPGNVTWSPYVFAAAEEHGLILLDDGSLVDTSSGESIPTGKNVIAPTTDEDVSRLRRMTAEELAECVVSSADLEPAPNSIVDGILDFPIIGSAIPDQGQSAGKMAWPHGFQLHNVCVDAGTASAKHSRAEEEVILMQSGELTVELEDGCATLSSGDVLTIPLHMARRFINKGSSQAVAYVVRGGNLPQKPTVIS